MINAVLPTEQLSDECERAVQQFEIAHERGRDAQRLGQMNAFIWISLVGWLGHALYLAYEGRWAVVSGLAACLMLTGVAWWYLKRAQNLRWSAWVLFISLSLGIGLACEGTGRLSSPSIWFVSLPVLSAAPFVRARDVRRMSAIPLGMISLFGLLEILEPDGGGAGLSSNHFLFSQVQMVFLYAYMSYQSSKMGERESNALKEHRQRATQAAKRAECENRNKTRFLAKMSHELRTPMNGLLGMVQYLETRGLPPESQSLLLRLRKRSEHILEHIRDALDLTLADSGSQKKEQEHFDLDKLVSRVCDVQTQFGSLTHCALDVHLDIEAKHYLGDNRRLRHLLSTLLGTAFQGSCDGRVGFRVRQAPLAANDTAEQGPRPVTFEVEYRIDEPVRLQERDTSVFSTDLTPELGATVSTVTGQSGQGGDLSSNYASVFRVASLLGGDFEVCRESHTQVRAVVRVPLQSVSVPESPSQLRAQGPARSASIGARRALVVDDNAINRKVAVLLLKKLGCASDTANDGLQAVEMAERGNYDAIFMDLRMPNLDGYEAARRILAARGDETTGCPIMALTANAFEEDVQKAKDAGMVTHIAKPVTLEKLAEVLQTYVPEQDEAQSRCQATGSDL